MVDRRRRRAHPSSIRWAAICLALGTTACAPLGTNVGAAVATNAPDALPDCRADALPQPRFEPGTARLTPEAATQVVRLAACLRRPTHDPFHLVVVGDPASSLLIDRAVTLRARLASHGVPPDRVAVRAPDELATPTPASRGDHLQLTLVRRLGPGCLTHMPEAPIPEPPTPTREEISWSSLPPAI